MGPLGLLLAASLTTTVTLSWEPAPGATAYRVYACQANESQCWGLDFARYWAVVAEVPEPRITAPVPDRPTWVAVANVYGTREVVRIGETVYVRPGPRFLER